MLSRGALSALFVIIGVSTYPVSGSSCFSGGVLKTIERSKPPTVALTRKLPPVVDLAGARVKIVVSKTANVVKDDPIDVMATKLRAVLLKDRGRGISLDDPHPDTELRVKVTTFELTEQQQTRPNGNVENSYTVILGNMESTVEVFDLKSGRALDSENLKDHYEKWFLIGTKSSGRGISNPLAHKPKVSNDDRLPTQSERVSDVVEGMANKIAQRLVPIDDRFDVELPMGFKDLESYAKAGNWGALKEKAESMTPLPKAEDDSCRLYLVGLANEAIGYKESDPRKAQDLLVAAADAYQKAKDSNKSEDKFNEPINRAQQSLERYITLEKISRLHAASQSRGVKVSDAGPEPAAAAPTPAPTGPAPVGAAAKLVYDNAYLIKLKSGSKASDKLLISEIDDADPAQFDISPNGIAQLVNAGMSEDVVLAVKKKMRSAPSQAKKKN